MTQFVGSGPAPTAQQQAPPVQAPPVQAPPAQAPLAEHPPVLQQQEGKEEEERVKEGIPQEGVPEAEENPSASVTPEAQPSLRGKKARVEFRDQNGNVLDESLVAQLQQQGKVSIESRFEYRSRLANGHEVDIVDGKVAPPHPDVEGQNPETVGHEEQWPVEDVPAPAAAGDKSSAGQESSSPQPEPASEGYEAT